MQLCPKCQKCYDDESILCSVDNSQLKHQRPGTQLVGNRYFIVRLLGCGGAGAVYEAIDLVLNRFCALKLQRLDRKDLDISGHLRFRREALVACQIDHRNIVKVFDLGTNPVTVENKGQAYTIEEHFVAMELLNGETLQKFLARNRKLEPGDALLITRQAAQGLAELHRREIVHRDVKPANLMLTLDRRRRLVVKTIDLGTVKLRGPNTVPDYSNLTIGFIGSPKYASPEVCNNQQVDSRADIYSLGLVLYEMIAGRPAFDQVEFSALVYKQAYDPPPPLTDVPEALVRLVNDAIEKDPKRRIKSAHEFIRRCRELERLKEFSNSGGERIISALRDAGYVPTPDGLELGLANEETKINISAFDPNLLVEATLSRPTNGNGNGNSNGGNAPVPPVESLNPPPTPALVPAPLQNSQTSEKARIALTCVFLLVLIVFSAIFLARRFVRSMSRPPETSVEQVTPPKSATFTGEIGEEAETTIDCNLRESSRAHSPKIGLVEKGSRVRILERRRNWRRIRVLQRGREQEDPQSEDEGWIDGNNLNAVGDRQA
jgi:serine/threonine protein kinase